MNLMCTISAVLVAVFVTSTINLVDGKPQSCRTNGRYVYDKCGQRCYCTKNKLVRCTRIRKEFPSMSLSERYRYIKTIRTASTNPKYKAVYDKLITKHLTIFDSGIHEVEHFLTWHRYYILQYENLMRRINCRFTVSYWDWSLVSTNPWRTKFFSPWYRRFNIGMGGNGSPPSQCVSTGPFRQGKWNLPASAGGGCLQRDFFGNTPDAVAVEELLRRPPSQFLAFESTLRVNLHNNVHCQIGGTMCSDHSASAPEFFLHHGMVDKIWADWQKKSSAHKNAYFPKLSGKVVHTPYYPKQLIDLNNQPGGVRVIYREPRNYARIYGFLRRLKLSVLKKIPRRGFTPLLKKTIALFRLRGSALRKAQALGKALQPSRRLRKMPSGSTDVESSIGFRLKTPSKVKAVLKAQGDNEG